MLHKFEEHPVGYGAGAESAEGRRFAVKIRKRVVWDKFREGFIDHIGTWTFTLPKREIRWRL